MVEGGGVGGQSRRNRDDGRRGEVSLGETEMMGGGQSRRNGDDGRRGEVSHEKGKE